ncbi:MAG TPA: HD domain-containing protein [Deltaproteobacteria bacterium]|nr:HD domain-containing protein [Deltaproteobacteria bacterium]
MKTIFVGDLKAGDEINDAFALAEKTLGQKKDGKPYLTVVLSDKTGSVKGVVWDGVEEIASANTAGEVVHVKGGVSEYRGELQVVIKKMMHAAPENVNASDFLPATSHGIDSMFERLVRMTESLKTDYLRALFESFWKDPDFVQKFKTAPAAKKMHHAYIGGLLEHTLSMALLVERIAGHYSGIDLELLLTGVILHDIGKIREFDYELSIDYSDEGRLLSHIIIGIQMVDEKLKQVYQFPLEKERLLKHMIISHHGTREFGSPEPPKTLEAVLLNYIDEIDSKVNGIREFLASEGPGAGWTSYHKILGRHFYKGKEPKETSQE